MFGGLLINTVARVQMDHDLLDIIHVFGENHNDKLSPFHSSRVIQK